MDEIKQRLTEASEACIKAYETWRAKNTDAGTREALMDAVHELRKVAARLEIELAVSERKQHGSEPIPIPSHRASRRQGQGAEMPESFEDDMRSNRAPLGNSAPAFGQGQNQGQGQRRQLHASMRRSPEAAAPVPAVAVPAPAAAEAVAVPAAAEAPAAPAAEEEATTRRPRPLSLRRTAPEAEQG